MFTILVIISLVSILVLSLVAFFIYRKLRERQDFDLEPRDRHGNKIEDDDEESDEDAGDQEHETDVAPIYDDDLGYDDFLSFEDLLHEIGIIDISNGMIEYETGDNSRLFVMLAEMQQSNPYLKTEEELAHINRIMEVFYNGVVAPLKESSQSQRVEMTDFLNDLKEHSQYLHGATPEMKSYAEQVIDDTLNYQRATDRFENKAYLQFQAVVTPEEVFGETVDALEQQIHEKAIEKLLRQIDRADGLLRRADHAITALDQFGLCEVLYKTFNKEKSVHIRLEDIIRHQNFALFTTSHQNDVTFKRIQQAIHIETQAINSARDVLWENVEHQNLEA